MGGPPLLPVWHTLGQPRNFEGADEEGTVVRGTNDNRIRDMTLLDDSRM